MGKASTLGLILLISACGGRTVGESGSDSDSGTDSGSTVTDGSSTDGGTGTASVGTTSSASDSGDSSGSATGGSSSDSSGSTTGLDPVCGDGVPDVHVACYVGDSIDGYADAVAIVDLDGDRHLDVVWASAFPCPVDSGGTHAHAVPGLTNAPDVVHEGAFFGFAYWAKGTGDGTPSPVATDLLQFDGQVRALFGGAVAGDAATDLLLVTESGLVVGTGDGAGGATPGTPTALPTSPASTAAGDLNGDGLLDVAVWPGNGVGPANSVDVWSSDGSGGFTASVTALAAADVVDLAVHDVNGDGNLDVVAVRGDGLQVLAGDGTGSLTPGAVMASPAAEPRALTLTDLNGDGALDAVTGHDADPQLALYLADGNGGFAPAKTVSLSGGVWALAGGQLDATPEGDVFALFQLGEATAVFGMGGDLVDPDSTPLVGYGHPATGDLNEDGLTDLAFPGGGTVQLFVSDP